MRHVLLFLFLIALAVPAVAVDVDLTTPMSSGSIGAALFATTDMQPTGTGIFMPFVRMQNAGMQSGFNTDAVVGSGDLADVKAGTWTHSILVGSITPVSYMGFLYYRFALDINETSPGSLLSLDELQIYTATSPSISTLATLTAQNLIYDMGAGNRVLMDYNLGSGSGSGDIFCYIPASLFAGLGDKYLYLYSKFGASGSPYTSDDGFEEWAIIESVVPARDTSWGAIKDMFRN